MERGKHGTKGEVVPSELRAWELKLLGELTKCIVRALDKRELVQAILGHAMNLTGFEMGGVYEVEPRTWEGVLLAHQGLAPQAAEAVAHIRVPAALRQARGLIFWDNVARAPSELLPEAGWQGLGSLAVVPLVAQDQMVGLLHMASRQRRR
ncbi:MAG: GAF domain-containing protein, partial [Anaerolineae bacterium]|nr:GAF domain-containing protein [Anaerolineae bacterium]